MVYIRFSLSLSHLFSFLWASLCFCGSAGGVGHTASIPALHLSCFPHSFRIFPLDLRSFNVLLLCLRQRSDLLLSNSSLPHTHFDAQGFKSVACPAFFKKTFLPLSPSSVPPVFSRSSPPPASPPLPAVFAGSFSARHPEAAVAPASLPTSVFVVGDDMSKL